MTWTPGTCRNPSTHRACWSPWSGRRGGRRQGPVPSGPGSPSSPGRPSSNASRWPRRRILPPHQPPAEQIWRDLPGGHLQGSTSTLWCSSEFAAVTIQCKVESGPRVIYKYTEYVYIYIYYIYIIWSYLIKYLASNSYLPFTTVFLNKFLLAFCEGGRRRRKEEVQIRSLFLTSDS